MRPWVRPARPYLARVAAAGVSAVLLMSVSAGLGHADTPTPTPSDTLAQSPSVSTPTAAPTATPTSTPKASSATPTADSQRRLTPQAEQAAGLTLAVRSTFGSGAMFWSDIGKYAFRGSASGLANGAPIEIYRRSSTSTAWTRLTTGQLTSGAYAVDYPSAEPRHLYVHCHERRRPRHWGCCQQQLGHGDCSPLHDHVQSPGGYDRRPQESPADRFDRPGTGGSHRQHRSAHRRRVPKDRRSTDGR